MKKLLVTTVMAMAVASCSQQPAAQTENLSVYDGEEQSAVPEMAASDNAGVPSTGTAQEDLVSGPDVAPSAAPGVAFNYRYAYRLANNRIAEVQEKHAAACERLGLARCRITGMRYQLVNDEDVQAMLAVKLDPAIARDFGRQAGDMVGEAEGMLVDSEISGVDAGASIANAERERARIGDDIAELERRLGRDNLSEGERVQLTQQLERLRQSRRGAQDRIETDEESLATTPMVFQYGSGEIVPGFDPQAPLSDAFARGGALFLGGVSVMIVLLAALLPWALVIGLIVLGIRALRPRWSAWRGPAAEGAE